MTKEDVPQALIHLSWSVEGEVRRLVFGWVEVLPTCFPPLRGHLFRTMRTRLPGPRLFVGRFPIDALRAEAWFEAAAKGDLRLPGHPDKVTPGDGQPLGGSPFRQEPENGSYSSALVLPFLPTIHGIMLTKGLFGTEDPEFARKTLTAPNMTWLRENMFIDLSVHPEYFGTLIFVRHHPVVRDVGSRLGFKAGREVELVQIRRWPGANLDGYRVLAVEQRLLGLGVPMELPAGSGLVELDWNGKSDKTALAVVHAAEGVAWWREPVGFLRSIQTNLNLIQETRRIVQEISADGTVIKSYDNAWRGSADQTLVSLVGDETDPMDPSDRGWRAKAHRKQLRMAASLGLRWFDDASTAQQAVRSIIEQARMSFQVVDPYFGPGQLLDFALAVTAGDVSITVVTSEECLLQRTEDRSELKCDSMVRALAEVSGRGWAPPTVLVMKGRRAPLHDRFLIADGRVWLSGNSLHAIGRRASVMIELPNPQEILRHLKPIMDEATLFPDWLSTRDRVAGSAGVASGGSEQDERGH